MDVSRAISMSAPSAINTDYTTVKFEEETTEWNPEPVLHTKSAMSHRFVIKILEILLFTIFMS